MPGVTIGDNTVIGGGSVVVDDIPSGVVAAGNPCKVIRPITEKDKENL
jgi:acetyltransferase-like isoleucine patch superfamily enzyme